MVLNAVPSANASVHFPKGEGRYEIDAPSGGRPLLIDHQRYTRARNKKNRPVDSQAIAGCGASEQKKEVMHHLAPLRPVP